VDLRWQKYLVITQINKICNISNNSKAFKVQHLQSIVLSKNFCRKETKIFKRIFSLMKIMKIRLINKINLRLIFVTKHKLLLKLQKIIILVLEEI